MSNRDALSFTTAVAIVLLSLGAVGCDADAKLCSSGGDGKSKEEQWQACNRSCAGDNVDSCKKGKELASDVCEETKGKNGCYEACENGDKKACKQSPMHDTPASTSSAPTTAAAPAPVAQTNEETTYEMGRKYGYSCVFAMLSKPEDTDRTYNQASAAATKLGVPVPPKCTKEGAMKTMRDGAPISEIKKKHDQKVAAMYALGVTVTDAVFGAMLESDIKKQLTDIGNFAKTGGIPDTVYKDALAAAQKAPNKDTVDGVSKAFDAHFKYRD